MRFTVLRAVVIRGTRRMRASMAGTPPPAVKSVAITTCCDSGSAASRASDCLTNLSSSRSAGRGTTKLPRSSASFNAFCTMV